MAPPAHADRVKDLASLASVRANQLLGYGLVVGLEGTGDGLKTQSLRRCHAFDGGILRVVFLGS